MDGPVPPSPRVVPGPPKSATPTAGEMMPNDKSGQPPQPSLVSILRQGSYLIASIHTALDDRQLTGFQHDLIERIGRDHSHGIIIDLTVIDVLDSFAARTLRNLAQMALLRGADTVLVGINPGVASTMTEFGINVDITPTALDLDDGIALLDELVTARSP